jgi:hypothetical protein
MWGRDFSPGRSDGTPELKFRLHTDLFRLHTDLSGSTAISLNRIVRVAAYHVEDFTRRS